MIRLVYRTDVHLAVQAPQSRTDDWAATVFDKLDRVGEIAREVGASAILDNGDFFHIKMPSRTTHELVRQVAAAHAGYVPVYANIGNHDCKYGDYAFLSEAPLGVLFDTGVFKRCYDQHEAVFTYVANDEDCTKTTVRVVGIPYHGKKYNLNRLTTITKGEEDFLVVMAHLLASPGGGEMFGGEDIIPYHELVNLDPDVWCFLPGTKILDWNSCQTSIESVSESLAVGGRAGPVVVEMVHPARDVDEDVVVLDVEGVPSSLIPGVTSEHPFWAAQGLRCRLPSRVTRRCHPDKPRDAHPCRSCYEPPDVRPEWVGAGQIVAGDYVSIPVCPIPPGDSVWEPGLARLLGYYLAEGHTILNCNGDPIAGVAWTFHSEETSLHTDVQMLVREHFGLDTHEHSQEKRDHSVQVCAYGKNLAAFMHEHGGRHAGRKEMSSLVWHLSAVARLELLVGWLLGDGHARDPGRYDRTKVEVMGATVSANLASQMHAIALSIGLRPFYTIRPAARVTWPNGHISGTLPCHVLAFYGDDAEMLGARLGVVFLEREKTKVAGFFSAGFYWSRVRGVTRQRYRGPVYNIRTSTQEYVAGLLLTHNCFGHWHKNQGVVKVGKKTIVNIGSLTRGALTEDEVSRIPECAVLSFDVDVGVSVERRPLKVQPAAEVFDLVGRTRQEARAMTVDAFVESVKTTLTAAPAVSLLDQVRALDAPAEVKERLTAYLEAEGAL